MPIDYKRINGPEISVPYQLFAKQASKSAKQQLYDLTSNGTRVDQRQPQEHRKIFLKCGVVSQAKGSAYIEVNNTKVIVSVFDPREIPNRSEYSLKGEIYCEFKFAPFSCSKRRLHQRDSEEKLFSSVMRQALEAAVCRHEFPNLQVDIYALVLHNDGAALSAAINAAGVALAHAGVPMYDLITSVTVALQNERVFLDPTLQEETVCGVPIEGDTHGIVILSMLNTHEQVTQLYQSGNLGFDVLKRNIDVLTRSCKEIVKLVEKCLLQHVIKTNSKVAQD